jgi:hypothetical protein
MGSVVQPITDVLASAYSALCISTLEHQEKTYRLGLTTGESPGTNDPFRLTQGT